MCSALSVLDAKLLIDVPAEIVYDVIINNNKNNNNINTAVTYWNELLCQLVVWLITTLCLTEYIFWSDSKVRFVDSVQYQVHSKTDRRDRTYKTLK